MQVAFFLLPKSETYYLYESFTLRQAVEKMQHHKLTALPILDNNGRYLGTITAADLLWYFKDMDLDMKRSAKIPLMDVPRLHDNRPVSVSARVGDLISAAMEQNFIPVIDDLGVFIGIVRRREILEQYQREFLEGKTEE